MMRHLTLLLLLLSALPGSLLGQKGLASGPMVGYSEMREVMLWVQTTEAAKVYFRYWEKGQPKGKIYSTNTIFTQKSTAFTAHCLADQVQPGREYEAQLYINGKKVKLAYPIRFQSRALWQWRTDPPAFKAVIGSCNFDSDSTYDRPGKPYGDGYEIFETILTESPDLMVWLGDNIYLREADVNTMTGIHYRYTHGRSIPELQPLLAQTHHYAIWDDHDFGPNDSDGSFVHKDKTLAAFKHFWANPSYGLPGAPGISGQFTWSDCDFFMVDNRYHRSSNWRGGGKRTMLGEAQLEWLLNALKTSRATFKFVCIGGMVLSTAALYENYIAIFPEERQYLLDGIQRDKIKGVIFLTGDRHHTELSKWHPEGGVVVYDLTVSPFTSGAYGGDKGANKHLVPGTEVGFTRNYGTLDVSGPLEKRVLRIGIKDKTGKELWQKEISAPK